jgi:hypothetical protein
MATKEEIKRDPSQDEGGDRLDELIHGESIVTEPLWRIRLRLFRKSFATNWGLFKESKMGVVGLIIIAIFGLMAVASPILMSTVWDPAIYDPVSGYDAVVVEYTIVEDGEVRIR